MSITCKAAVLRNAGADQPYAETNPLVIETITLDPPKSSEVLVKIAGAGLCHSDLSYINGARGKPNGMILGHEGSGEIVEVGAGVMDIKPGDHIIFQFSPSCGRCARCQSGRPQVCEAVPAARAAGHLIGGGSRMKDANGAQLLHFTGVSCFSEYAVVDRSSVVKVDDQLPLADAALFGCAVMTGVGAVVNTAGVKMGEKVAVVGLGGVGLCGVMGAAAAGAEIVVAIDLDDAKLARALEVGATHAFNAKDPDLVAKVKDLTNGGVDYGVDLAGAVPALRSAYDVTVRGGAVVTAGLPAAGAKFEIDPGELVANEKKICGSYMGSCVPVRDIPRYIELYRRGMLPVDSLIDGHIGLEDINAGFDKLASGGAVRQVLTPHM